MCLYQEKKLTNLPKEKDHFIGYCTQVVHVLGIDGLYNHYYGSCPIKIGNRLRATGQKYSKNEYGFYGTPSIIPAVCNARAYSMEEELCTIVVKCKFEGLIAKGKAQTGLSDKADSYTTYRCKYRTILKVERIFGENYFKERYRKDIKTFLKKLKVKKG